MLVLYQQIMIIAMERIIESVLKRTGRTDPRSHGPAPTDSTAFCGKIATGTLDQRSLIFAFGGTLTFFGLGLFCLSIARFDAALISVWIPNASAVALLLLARLRNELPIYTGIVIASLSAHFISGYAADATLAFTAANIVDIALVTWLTRRACGAQPDMTDLTHLGRFLMYGGLIGPVASASIAIIAMGSQPSGAFTSATAWFLANSMGMILTVPAALLINAAIHNQITLTTAQLFERSAMMIGGLVAVFLVFNQEGHPFLFLVPPITLLMAFRLGPLGTALYVPGIAVLASWMAYAQIGPIAPGTGSGIGKMYAIQAIVAANFLIGLPIAAILAGRARLTEQLAEGRAELALLTDNVTDAVLNIDNRGVCTYASPSVRDVLGREPNDLIGHIITERSHEDAGDRIALALDRLLGGQVDKERVTYRRLMDAEDGRPVFIEADCTIAFSSDTGDLSGVVVSARDVTERVELELLLTRARRHAEHAARAKSNFLANMSHEIRTPMNGVLGFAELMLQDKQTDDHRRHTEMIVQSGRSMMLLLNDILDLSKIEAGKITIDHAPFDLFATIAECVTLHRTAAEGKGLKLIFNPHYCGPDGCGGNDAGCSNSEQVLWVTTDALRLRQIILNLVANAVKFTEQGSVEISCHIHDNEVIIEVKDTGIGISPSRIQTIFSPFTQAENDIARRFGGTGLGLTISRKLAELLSGKIEVESEPEIGSKFRITFPAIIVEPRIPLNDQIEDVKPVDLPKSARILLAEDHDVNRQLGSKMLERCGQSVEIAHDGNEAIAMVIDSMMRGKPYDLVFMDIQMPGCDGFAATRAIRDEGIGPDIMPIIALTANAFSEDISEAKEAGMQAHLSKPLVFADLARVLQRWLPTRIVESEDPEPEDPYSDDCTQWDYGPHDPRQALAHKTSTIDNVAPRAAAASANSSTGSQTGHSPELIDRWNKRRAEAVEAVRTTLECGTLSDSNLPPGLHDELARLVHKLAGTAAIFGEPELGDHAAAFERALRQNLSGEVREALAFELLSVADDPAETFAATGS